VDAKTLGGLEITRAMEPRGADPRRRDCAGGADAHSLRGARCSADASRGPPFVPC